MTRDRLKQLQKEYLPLSLQTNYFSTNVTYRVVNDLLQAIKTELTEEDIEEVTSHDEDGYTPFKKFSPTDMRLGDIFFLHGLKHYVVFIGERLDTYMFVLLTSGEGIPSIPTNSRFIDSYFSYGITSLYKEDVHNKIKFKGVYGNDEHLIDVIKQIFNFYKTDFNESTETEQETKRTKKTRSTISFWK